MVWRRFLCRSTKTTSLRGTITSRTVVSPSSKTEWIIFRSPASISADASAMSTSSRSSVSVENGPSRKPLPGVSALPSRISSRGSGPSTEVTQVSGAADQSATRSLCCRPSVRGATPMTTNDTTSITPIVASALGHHEPSKASVISRVTSTIAEISQSRRSRIAVFRYGAGSASIVTSRREPGLPLGLQLLGAGAGERRQRGVRGREAGRPAAPAPRPGRRSSSGPAGLVVPPLGSSSRSWRPNISWCSSGSAWS